MANDSTFNVGNLKKGNTTGIKRTVVLSFPRKYKEYGVLSGETNIDIDALLHAGDGFFTLNGSVRGVISAECALCLKAVDIVIDAEINGMFMTEPSLRGTYNQSNVQRNSYNGNTCVPENTTNFDEPDIWPVEDGRIDLLPAVTNSILSSVPLKMVCSDDCKGLCLKCGADLNVSPCGCTG